MIIPEVAKATATSRAFSFAQEEGTVTDATDALQRGIVASAQALPSFIDISNNKG
jgi:hypothetical protein